MKEHIIQFKQRVSTNLLKIPFYQCVFYSVAIVGSNKNKSKSGDITWHSNFRDALCIVVNREVTTFKGKESCLGIFSALDVREVTLLLKT